MKLPGSVTEDDVRRIIEGRIEDDATPEAVLEIWKRENGKRFTKNILGKLPGGEETWRVDQVANMTNIQTWEYSRSRGDRGISLLVAYATKNIVVDAAFLEERNPAHYLGRRERNAARRALLGDPKALREMAAVLGDVIEARERFEEADARLGHLIDCGGTFFMDRYEFQRIAKKGIES